MVPDPICDKRYGGTNTSLTHNLLSQWFDIIHTNQNEI